MSKSGRMILQFNQKYTVSTAQRQEAGKKKLVLTMISNVLLTGLPAEKNGLAAFGLEKPFQSMLAFISSF